MRISSPRPQTNKVGWFHNRERQPNVISASPAENLRDGVSLTGTVALSAGAAAATISSLGAGPFSAVALAVPIAVAGSIVGGEFVAPVLQDLAAKALSAETNWEDRLGASMGGGVAAGLAAGAGAIAAGFGADASTVALTAAALGGGFMTLASVGVL